MSGSEVKSHRGLRLLSRSFSWIGTIQLDAGIVGMVIFPVIAIVCWQWQLHAQELNITDVEREIATILGSPNFRILMLVRLADVSLNLCLTGIFWQQLALLVQNSSKREFVSEPTIRILNRIFWLFLISYVFECSGHRLYTALDSSAVILVNRPFSTINNFRGFLKSIYEYRNEHGLVVPYLSGSIKILLAVGSRVIAHIVRYTIGLEAELKDIKAEHALIV